MSEEISREEIAALLARESMSEKMTMKQAIDYFRTQTAYLGGKDKQACEIAILAIAALSAEPCEDAISRQAVLGLAYDMSEIDGEHFTEPCMVVDVEDIQKLPPVTPKQRTGHWIKIPKYGKWICSECGTKFRFTFKEHDYCPNCGTKMDGVGYVDIPDEKNDWYDVPSDEMTLEQARQAVKDLRKKLMEYLEQEPCDKCEVGNPCLYCKHEFEPQESEEQK